MTHRLGRRALCLMAALAALLAGCRQQPTASYAPLPAADAAEPAPAPAPDKTAKLHFVVYGDCRSRPEKHRLVAEQIAKVKPEVIIQTGDLIGDGSKPDEWKQALEIIAPLRAAAKYYAAMGNHEKKFDYVRRNLDPPADADKTYYSVLAANCRFLMLDTTTLRLEKGDEAQMNWLRAELAKPRAADEHLYVAMHHPAYTIGSYAPGDLTVRRRLHKLFVEAGVEAVFCGHDHMFYRTARDGVLYVVAAGGGAPLYDPKPDQAQKGDVYRKALHFVDIQVDGAKASARVIDETGKVFDSFALPLAKPAVKPETKAAG